MKTFLLLACSFLFINCICSQKQITPVIKLYKPVTAQCMSSQQEKNIKESVQKNVQRLMALGILHLPTLAEKTTASFQLGWPLKPSSNFTDSNYYGISNFVDHDPTTGLLDWNCGMRTYDGHNGTDIVLWPFPWYMMDNKMVKVIAAYDGVIVDKHDGEFDRECDAPNVPANYVVLQHSNGYQTIYYHLKTGTVTTKAIGASVSKGELLGYVGSSGSSTAPHLHFGVYDASANVLDPYKGSCNTITSSLWKKQDPYWGRKIHKIMVTTTPTVYPYCPNTEQINEFNTVPLGWTGHFFIFLSEVKAGDTVFLKIVKPDGSIWQNFNYVYPGDYSFAYAYWISNFDLNEPKGTWKWKVTYNKKTFSYNFTVTDVVNLVPNTADNDASDNRVAQKPVDKNNDVEKISVFPNPSKENILVQLNCDAGNYQLEILNAAGTAIKTQSITIGKNKPPLNIHISGITPGMYQLHVFNEQTNLNNALVIE